MRLCLVLHALPLPCPFAHPCPVLPDQYAPPYSAPPAHPPLPLSYSFHGSDTLMRCASGHDTTASLIGWTMWFLTQHPQVEARLVAEILEVMEPDTQPTYQQLSSMRYLNAVLKVGGCMWCGMYGCMAQPQLQLQFPGLKLAPV